MQNKRGASSLTETADSLFPPIKWATLGFIALTMIGAVTYISDLPDIIWRYALLASIADTVIMLIIVTVVNVLCMIEMRRNPTGSPDPMCECAVRVWM